MIQDVTEWNTQTDTSAYKTAQNQDIVWNELDFLQCKQHVLCRKGERKSPTQEDRLQETRIETRLIKTFQPTSMFGFYCKLSFMWKAFFIFLLLCFQFLRSAKHVQTLCSGHRNKYSFPNSVRQQTRGFPQIVECFYKSHLNIFVQQFTGLTWFCWVTRESVYFSFSQSLQTRVRRHAALWGCAETQWCKC